MVEHLVDQHAHAALVAGFHQPDEIIQRAEQRVDAAVVGHVVAEILHRRGEEGRQPDGVDVEAGDVVQLVQHAGQVAHAIAVAVKEAARVDLIDHPPAPPVLKLLGHTTYLE